jgi:hypothetical protein
MKLQIPSSKLQRSASHQAPKRRQQSLAWCLRLGISLVIGCWSLEPASAAPKGPPPIISTSTNGSLIYDKDERGNRVPDFSNCGYAGGDKQIPDAPVRVVVSPVRGDETASKRRLITSLVCLLIQTACAARCCC